MKRFRYKEAQPLALTVPQSEPTIRVGIVLEQDKKREIEFYLQDEGILILGDGKKIYLEPDRTYHLKRWEDGFLLLDQDDNNLFQIQGKIVLNPGVDLEPAPKVGVQINNIVAGRGFHWQKELPETFLGSLEFIPANDYIIVVNVIGIEFYTICAVASEMSGGKTPPESGKAQATAIRSWAYVFLGSKYTDKPYQICNDDLSQRYQGTTHLQQEVIDLVRPCRGDYITFENGIVAPAYYSKSCGGHIESSEVLFGCDLGNPPTYFDSPAQEEIDLSKDAVFEKWLETQPREKFFCGQIPDAELKQYLGAVDEAGEYFRWQYTVTADVIKKKLYERCGLEDVAEICDIVPKKRGVSGRYLSMDVVYLNIQGTREKIKLADQFYIRACMHESFLYSSAFIFKCERSQNGYIEKVHFKGAGWGHGGGFCQIGAVGMALAGYTYQDIINHYYPNTRLVNAY